jgi:hypothetical protein
MGIVGRWLTETCATHPALMQEVLSRPIGRLSEWIDWDAEGGPCGCLIGTAALAAGVAESEGTRDPCEFLSEKIGREVSEIEEIGLRVYDISYRFENGIGTPASDARVIAMIRTRIAVALAVRESVPVGTEELAEVPA